MLRKDIVLRVIAAGLNPENCTVARVMTPTPDTAAPETTVLDALKLMNNGHYLNLPVIGRGTIIGMVDVLKLTYVTLEQVTKRSRHIQNRKIMLLISFVR
jgi:CBS domain-containing protein